jgi:hypothetical protein
MQEEDLKALIGDGIYKYTDLTGRLSELVEDQVDINGIINGMVESGFLICANGVEDRFICLGEFEDKYLDAFAAIDEAGGSAGFFDGVLEKVGVKI